jgi:hypothetical protein
MKKIKELIIESTTCNDGKRLSTILVELSSHLYTMSEEMGNAQDEYNQAVVEELLESKSVAQAERKADVITKTKHDRIKYLLQALQEHLKSIKVKINVLLKEYEANLGENLGEK